MRVAPVITLTPDQRTTLQQWARGRSTPMRLVRRAQIVLRAADNEQNQDIAEELGLDRTVVNRWRRRFAEKGLAGIAKDAPRGGRPATKRQQMVARISWNNFEMNSTNELFPVSNDWALAADGSIALLSGRRAESRSKFGFVQVLSKPWRTV